MAELITPRQFHDSEGIDDWRVLYSGAAAHFATGSFVTGVALVEQIRDLAEQANHHPDVDLRYGSVTVRTITHDVGGLSDKDVDLCRKISAAARELGIAADPAAVQDIALAIDVASSPEVMPFWRAVLGYRQVGDANLEDPNSRGPSIWFQELDAPRPQRNRIHVDVSVPHDQAESRVAAALEAGGRLVSDEHAPQWWTLADPEGNEVDLASWLGRT